MLACARIGAVHSVVAGFHLALADRINDCKQKWYLPQMEIIEERKYCKVVVDEALEKTNTVEVIVCKRTGSKVQMKTGRDLWWHDVIKNQSFKIKAASLDSEDLLFYFIHRDQQVNLKVLFTPQLVTWFMRNILF